MKDTNLKQKILIFGGITLVVCSLFTIFNAKQESLKVTPNNSISEQEVSKALKKEELTEYWKIELMTPKDIAQKLKLSQSYLDNDERAKALKVLELSAESSIFHDLEIAAFYRDNLEMPEKANELLKRAELVSFQALDHLRFAWYFKKTDPQKCRDYVLMAARHSYRLYRDKVHFYGFEFRHLKKQPIDKIMDFCLNELVASPHGALDRICKK